MTAPLSHPTLGGLFHAACNEVPPTLIDRGARATLDRIVAAVPGYADTAGFEVRLDGNDGRVDLGVGISLTSGGGRFLGEPDSDAALARAVRTEERWRRLHEFGLRWTVDPTWRLRAPFLFLEYDEDTPLQPLPVPSVFVSLDWPLGELGQEARRQGLTDPMLVPGLADVKRMLAVLRPQPLSPAADALFAKCFALVPAGGLVLHLAVMLGRPGASVRLSLSVPCDGAAAYFDALGWSRGLSALGHALSFEAEASGSGEKQRLVQIDVDVGGTLGPVVGVMLQPSLTGSWPRLLDALVAAEYCDRERRDALLEWPREASNGSDAASLERYLAHAKITCGKDVAPKAKAYIGVRPRRP